MPEIEAIQVELIGRPGVILIPGDPTKPPEWITDEYIYMLEDDEFKRFRKPNSKGKVFHYKQNVPKGKWYLVE
jgi:hypothetical protein